MNESIEEVPEDNADELWQEFQDDIRREEDRYNYLHPQEPDEEDEDLL